MRRSKTAHATLLLRIWPSVSCSLTYRVRAAPLFLAARRFFCAGDSDAKASSKRFAMRSASARARSMFARVGARDFSAVLTAADEPSRPRARSSIDAPTAFASRSTVLKPGSFRAPISNVREVTRGHSREAAQVSKRQPRPLPRLSKRLTNVLCHAQPGSWLAALARPCDCCLLG